MTERMKTNDGNEQRKEDERDHDDKKFVLLGQRLPQGNLFYFYDVRHMSYVRYLSQLSDNSEASDGYCMDNIVKL